MQPLKDEIKKYPILREKLFSIEFLSSSNKVLVSLLYHKKLDNDWGEYAKKLEENLKRNKEHRKVILVLLKHLKRQNGILF